MTSPESAVRQEQFLEVVDCEEARRRFEGALRLAPWEEETVAIDAALDRVLARDVVAPVDVPSFDRANVDGFAVRAADTFGAREEAPCRLRLGAQVLATGVVPSCELTAGWAMAIATGGMTPRGADAVVMVEHTDARESELLVYKPATPGAGITFAGTDICRGETVLRRGELLTSRETGVLAAIGMAQVHVWRRPRVAIISTGDELIEPGAPMQPALVYDSNARTLADAVREAGGQPQRLGIVGDDLQALRVRLAEALATADVVLLSGGTSKGAGDLSYRAVATLTDPGIVAHGVALKPGKPLCLAASGGKPVAVLPGFPTSAIFTFHEFIAPVIRRLAGRPDNSPAAVEARLAVRVISESGRTEYLLVGLAVADDNELAAYPLGKGSGSVTTFGRADGFVTIERHTELLESGSRVRVQLLGARIRPPDLVAIGSHCVGLDLLLSKLHERGWQTKFMAAGSTAGLAAAARGECDVAGIHLLDSATGQYNEPFLRPGLRLARGYRRMQGVVYRPGDTRFEGRTATAAIQAAAHDPTCVMINRNAGSGTRILLDELLEGAQPPGHAVQPRSHNAVAAAVAQGRADWGLAIESVARAYGLGFLPLKEEHFDLVVPASRWDRPAVAMLRALLSDGEVRQQLAALGCRV